MNYIQEEGDRVLRGGGTPVPVEPPTSPRDYNDLRGPQSENQDPKRLGLNIIQESNESNKLNEYNLTMVNLIYERNQHLINARTHEESMVGVNNEQGVVSERVLVERIQHIIDTLVYENNKLHHKNNKLKKKVDQLYEIYNIFSIFVIPTFLKSAFSFSNLSISNTHAGPIILGIPYTIPIGI